MNPLLPTLHRRSAPLGDADRALLDRLRTIALLLRLGRGALFALGDIHLAILFDPKDKAHLLPSITSRAAYRLIAQAAGRDDLLAQLDQPDNRAIPCYRQIFALLAKADLPARCPLGLARLLARVRPAGDDLSPSDSIFLAAARWTPHRLGYLRPLLPDAVSAHEALDAFTRAEEGGGLGDGPLAVLAHWAARGMAGGPRP